MYTKGNASLYSRILRSNLFILESDPNRFCKKYFIVDVYNLQCDSA